MLLWYGLLHARNSLLRFGTWLPARNRDRAKIVPIPIWRLDPNYWSDPEEPRNENSLAGRKWLFKFMARKKICCTELRKRKHIKNGNTTVIISVHTVSSLCVLYVQRMITITTTAVSIIFKWKLKFPTESFFLTSYSRPYATFSYLTSGLW